MKNSPMRIRRPPKNQSKEAFRLWFEFLKRAIAENPSDVDMKHYAEWGDIANYSFTKWWKEIGETITARHTNDAEFVSAGSADESSYLIRVPKSFTSTQIGEKVRKLLIEAGHQPIKQSSVHLQEGFQIRPLIYRAYLHTYDENKKLLKIAKDGKVPKRELLVAVRKIYLAKQKRYANNVFKVDSMPAGIVGNFDPKNPEKFDVLAEAQATANIAKYLREACLVIEAVKQGKFPR
jgi:hypothetical protein